MNAMPLFATRPFLEDHIRRTMEFYDRNAIDPNGGFFHYLMDDGTVYDASSRHLVSSTRFVINYAKAARHFKLNRYVDLARHGLDYIERAHLQPSEGYAWVVSDGKAIDPTNHSYGLCFVVLAYAEAYKAGINEAKAGLDKAYALLCKRFWLPEYRLFADEYDANFTVLSKYRGQNANMHGCEALISAYEATGEMHYLDRAILVADNVTGRLAGQANGLIWEHYDPTWSADWSYNLNDPKHLFRPWGFQTGHHTEWCKLLLTLHRYRASPVLVQRARWLFDHAVEKGWDQTHGGLVYGFAPDGSVCDSDKYFWVQAESIAAASLLDEYTSAGVYSEWYQRLWEYSWQYFVDHDYGAWFRILDRFNRKYSNEKSPAGKTDYHTMGACFEVLDSLSRRERGLGEPG